MADDFNNFIRLIVDEAAISASRNFSGTSPLFISDDAKEELTRRAIQHAAEVQEQLESGEATRDSILQAAVAQFTDAATLAAQSNEAEYVRIAPPGPGGGYSRQRIGADAFQKGMQAKCHWIPWC